MRATASRSGHRSRERASPVSYRSFRNHAVGALPWPASVTTEGIAQLQTGLAGWGEIGARWFDTQWLGFLAKPIFRAGQFDDAIAALDQAAETAAVTGERHYQAELYRLKGAVLAAIGDTVGAASWLQRAIDTARNQQAKSLELRAATSLARLWGDQGERRRAHELLAPIYDWFTEGFETQDLKDARALVEQLS